MFLIIKKFFNSLFSKKEIIENKKRYCKNIGCTNEIIGRTNKLFCSESCKKKYKYWKQKLNKQTGEAL